MRKLIFIEGIVCALILCAGSIALGDWDPDDPCKMHFPQLPNPNGWDVCLNCQYIADDFRCTETGPITDIHFWISWKEDRVGDLLPSMLDVMIYSNTGGKPGMKQWSFTGGTMKVRPYGQGQQGWVCPSPPPLIVNFDHTSFYQVNLTNLEDPFEQQAGQIYWLVIKINLPTSPWPQGPAVGWKTSTTRFGAPAVWSNATTPWTPISLEEIYDQAFVITGEPDQPQMDFGDAPDVPYPTLLINDGARHKIDSNGPWLGPVSDFPDFEPDGQPDSTATGDNNNGNNDENGVLFSSPLIQGQMATISIVVSSGDGNGGFVTGWIDFDGSGSWDPGEQIVANSFPDGTHTVSFTVPPTSILGPTFARFRICRQGAFNPTGAASDGEVEDYMVIIEENPPIDPEHDLGDAPDSTNNWSAVMTAYPTGVTANFPTVFSDPTGSSPGPLHRNPLGGAWLGPFVSLENEADIGPDADGVNNIDPVNNIPDQDRADDGLLLPVRMPRCKWTNVRYLVNTVTPGIYYFNLWADWNRDGDWDDQVSGCSLGDVPEWAVRNQLLKLNAGPSMITSLPFVSWHDPNELPEQLWVRITLSDQPWEEIWGAGGCGPAAGYAYGETEDYYLTPNTSCTECADLNCDGFINLEDLAELSRQWLGSCP